MEKIERTIPKVVIDHLRRKIRLQKGMDGDGITGISSPSSLLPIFFLSREFFFWGGGICVSSDVSIQGESRN
jgi:hypothetical protein